MAFSAGQRLTAQLLNAALGESESDTQNAVATTTSSSYTSVTTGGAVCGVPFVAPASGKVLIHNSAFMDNSAAGGRTYCSWIIRTGSIVGSGVTFMDGGDATYIAQLGGDDVTAGRTYEVTGLTPGASYNAQQTVKTSAGTTASYSWRHLVVEPVT